MRDFPHVALLHVTARAIINRLAPFADLKRQCAAFFGVACQTLCLEIIGRFLASRLHVRIMTTDATQLLAARAITLAQSHRVVVFEQVLLRRGLALRREHENREGVIERGSRAEILYVS